MRKPLVAGIFVMLIIATLSLTTTTVAETQAAPMTVPLVAGKYTNVGTISVWNDGVNLHVEYETTDGALLGLTHLYVGKTDPSLLTCAPGSFPYSKNHNPAVDFYPYIIPLADIDGYHLKVNKKGMASGKWKADRDPGVEAGDQIFIAAHAEVCYVVGYEPDLPSVELSLPAQATLTILECPGLSFGKPSYFDSQITNGGTLNGIYDGYCADTDNQIGGPLPITHVVDVYSSYEPLPMGAIEHPENLPLVNWIINQDWVGKEATCGGFFTYGDVQRAIWAFIEDEQAEVPHVQCRVDEIYADALANGVDYEPGCDENVVIILIPTDGAQITIIWIPVPCVPVYCCETAWGLGGLDFPSANWAEYFSYVIS
jgi:hypothetical protein